MDWIPSAPYAPEALCYADPEDWRGALELLKRKAEDPVGYTADAVIKCWKVKLTKKEFAAAGWIFSAERWPMGRAKADADAYGMGALIGALSDLLPRPFALIDGDASSPSLLATWGSTPQYVEKLRAFKAGSAGDTKAMSDPVSFGDRLTQLLSERGLTQAALSEAAAIDRSLISRLCRDERKPTRFAVDRIAAALTITKEELLAGANCTAGDLGKSDGERDAQTVTKALTRAAEAEKRAAAAEEKARVLTGQNASLRAALSFVMGAIADAQGQITRELEARGLAAALGTENGGTP